MSRFAIKERQTLGKWASAILPKKQHPFSAQRRKAKEGCTKIFKVNTQFYDFIHLLSHRLDFYGITNG